MNFLQMTKIMKRGSNTWTIGWRCMKSSSKMQARTVLLMTDEAEAEEACELPCWLQEVPHVDPIISSSAREGGRDWLFRAVAPFAGIIGVVLVLWLGKPLIGRRGSTIHCNLPSWCPRQIQVSDTSSLNQRGSRRWWSLFCEVSEIWWVTSPELLWMLPLPSHFSIRCNIFLVCCVSSNHNCWHQVLNWIMIIVSSSVQLLSKISFNSTRFWLSVTQNLVAFLSITARLCNQVLKCLSFF